MLIQTTTTAGVPISSKQWEVEVKRGEKRGKQDRRGEERRGEGKRGEGERGEERRGEKRRELFFCCRTGTASTENF